jgi:putative copper resistance protein D
LWVGGLLALVVHGRGSGARLAPTAARFSVLALACFVAAGASGLLNAWILLGGTADAVGQALGSGYGVLLLGKLTALVVLGAFGWWHRRHTLVQLAGGRPRAFRRFAAVEVVVMLCTVALAVALAASPPPPSAATPSAFSATEEPGDGAPAEAEPAPAGAASQDMRGHDHGELSVGVLIDDTRFHVSSPVSPGQLVTVNNQSTTEVTITADDGSFDVVARGQTLLTFAAPDTPGGYRFTSRHSPEFMDVLVVR